MFVREEEKTERLYLYVVRDDEQPPSFIPIALSFLSLLLVIAVGVLFPYRPLLVRQTLHVPAIFLPLQTFSVTIPITPTGVQTVPATRATGVLTITNGSILSQHLPAGMIVTAVNGVEVITTKAADVPAGNGTNYGIAYVSAQVVVAGVNGNLASFAIDAVYGTSLYIKNDQPFTGGKNSYRMSVIQPQDRQDALTKARVALLSHTLDGLLSGPCTEQVTGVRALSVTWSCQFVSYHQVAGQVLSARVQGRSIVVEVLVAAPKQIRETK